MTDIEETEGEGDGERKKHEADLQLALCATAIGFNELARMTQVLGEKVYFRLARDEWCKLAVAAGAEISFVNAASPELNGQTETVGGDLDER